MKSGVKKWSTIVDYFLVLSSIVGVGFASGKEICVFFFDFGSASILGLVFFSLVYIYQFLIVQYISRKLELKTYNEFSENVFGKLCAFSNSILLINFSITCSAMLSGADYLFQEFFNIGFRIPSIILSILTLILISGGINKIRAVSNFILPIMIAVIVVNSLKNITPQNVHFSLTFHSGYIAVFYGLLFAVNNFIVGLPVLFETGLKTKGKLLVVLTVAVIILMNILTLSSVTFTTEMPLFEISKNVSKMFYYIYFITMAFAIFSTLIICSYNMKKIICKNNNYIFVSICIVLSNLILSNLGYNFIVQYLYVVGGILSGIFIIMLIISIIFKLIKLNKKIN